MLKFIFICICTCVGVCRATPTARVVPAVPRMRDQHWSLQVVLANKPGVVELSLWSAGASSPPVRPPSASEVKNTAAAATLAKAAEASTSACATATRSWRADGGASTRVAIPLRWRKPSPAARLPIAVTPGGYLPKPLPLPPSCTKLVFTFDGPMQPRRHTRASNWWWRRWLDLCAWLLHAAAAC